MDLRAGTFKALIFSLEDIFFSDRRGAVRLQPGMAPAIGKAQALGFRCVGLTGLPEKTARNNLRAVGIDMKMDFVIAAADADPDKNPYRAAAARLGAAAGDCVVFESSETRIKTARDAGITQIVRPSDFTTPGQFEGKIIALGRTLSPQAR